MKGAVFLAFFAPKSVGSKIFFILIQVFRDTRAGREPSAGPRYLFSFVFLFFLLSHKEFELIYESCARRLVIFGDL